MSSQCQLPDLSTLQGITASQISSIAPYLGNSGYDICVGSTYVSPDFGLSGEIIVIVVEPETCNPPDYTASHPEALSYILPYLTGVEGTFYGGACTVVATLGDGYTATAVWVAEVGSSYTTCYEYQDEEIYTCYIEGITSTITSRYTVTYTSYQSGIVSMSALSIIALAVGCLGLFVALLSIGKVVMSREIIHKARGSGELSEYYSGKMFNLINRRVIYWVALCLSLVCILSNIAVGIFINSYGATQGISAVSTLFIVVVLVLIYPGASGHTQDNTYGNTEATVITDNTFKKSVAKSGFKSLEQTKHAEPLTGVSESVIPDPGVSSSATGNSGSTIGATTTFAVAIPAVTTVGVVTSSINIVVSSVINIVLVAVAVTIVSSYTGIIASSVVVLQDAPNTRLESTTNTASGSMTTTYSTTTTSTAFIPTSVTTASASSATIDKLVHTFVGHTDGVQSVFVSGNYLYSGSDDETIKQWDITTGSNTYTFIGHTGSVNSVLVSGNSLYSGSTDDTIKQWDIPTGSNTHTFIGHTNIVWSVFVSGNYLYSGSFDNTIKQWDITTGSNTYTFIGHTSVVESVFVSGSYLYSGSNDETIKQWDITTGSNTYTFTGHTNAVKSVFVSGNSLYSGSADDTIKQWDITTGSNTYTFVGHTNNVTSVFVSGNYLYSGSDDDTIKQWDI